MEIKKYLSDIFAKRTIGFYLYLACILVFLFVGIYFQISLHNSPFYTWLCLFIPLMGVLVSLVSIFTKKDKIGLFVFWILTYVNLFFFIINNYVTIIDAAVSALVTPELYAFYIIVGANFVISILSNIALWMNFKKSSKAKEAN